MRTLIILIVLLFAGFSTANASKGLPSFNGIMLEKQLEELLPEYKEPKNDGKEELVRFRAELEIYRERMLEGFNSAIIEYREKLVESDRELELDRSRGKISREYYSKRHQYIKSELKKSRASGEYMQVYFDYLGIYKTLSDWVNQLLA